MTFHLNIKIHFHLALLNGPKSADRKLKADQIGEKMIHFATSLYRSIHDPHGSCGFGLHECGPILTDVDWSADRTSFFFNV